MITKFSIFESIENTKDFLANKALGQQLPDVNLLQTQIDDIKSQIDTKKIEIDSLLLQLQKNPSQELDSSIQTKLKELQKSIDILDKQLKDIKSET